MANYSCNYRSKINVYQQQEGACAFACAGMCVKKSPAQLNEAGFSSIPAKFADIANYYGYTSVDDPGPGYVFSPSNTPAALLEKLKLGYPIIMQTRANGFAQATADHWVVVYAFSGNDSSPSFSHFTCADPATNNTMSLDTSDKFKGFYRYVYYNV